MSSDLLQTKLFTLRLRSSLVPRPQLIDKLNQGLSGKLILVSAPAGFGKTTLVNEWTIASKMSTAWGTFAYKWSARCGWWSFALVKARSVIAKKNSQLGLDLARQHDILLREQAKSLRNLGQIATMRGDYAAAGSYYQES